MICACFFNVYLFGIQIYSLSFYLCPECSTKPYNLVLLLDASNSMRHNWAKEYKFAYQFYKTLKIDANIHPKSHLGLIYFASYPYTVLRLNNYQYQDAGSFEKKLKELETRGRERAFQKQGGSSTCTARAIDEASKMFQNISSNRKSVQNVLVLVTDGVSDQGQGMDNENLTSLVNDLKGNCKVSIMTVGVGLNKLEAGNKRKALKVLNFIASKSDVRGKKGNLFYGYDNFETLPKDVQKMALAICIPSVSNETSGKNINPIWTGGEAKWPPLRVFAKISQKRFRRASRNFVNFKTYI